MTEAAQTDEPRWPRSWSLPPADERGRLNGSGKFAVNCKLFGRGRGK